MLRKIIMLLLVVILGYFLYLRYKVSISAPFDIDEFAHLHWSYNLFSGKNPYTDFFYFFPPLFLYFLSPLFLLTGKSVAILIYARLLMFAVFCLAALVLFFLVKKIRNLETALLATLIFVYLPIPLNKWIEIRPDPLASLAILIAMFFLISENFLFSGLFYSLAALILPKMGLYALVAFFLVKGSKFYSFILGALIPVTLVVLLFFSYGDFDRALYLTTTVAGRATSVLGSKFPIPPNFLFYPNDVYFGAPGESLPWMTNLALWIIGIIVATLQFISFLDSKSKKEAWVKLLLSSSFLINLIVFIQVLRLRHGQYLVPFSFFIAYYAANFIMRLRRIILVLVIFLIFLGGWEMFSWKLSYSNQGALDHYVSLYKIVGGEKVIDLTGETVFGNDAYYFCCVPYGQYIEVLDFSYPNLEKSIKEAKVKFVHVQTLDRLNVLPERDREVIRKYFVPYNNESNPFLLIAK